MTTGRPALALPILTVLVNDVPEETGYLRALLQCQLALGSTDSAKQLLARSFAGPERHAFQYYFQGAIRLHEGDRAGALSCFREAESLDPDADFLPVLIGHCYAGKRLWVQAEASYRRALERDPDLAEAYVGMAGVELHRKRYIEATGHALSALGLRYGLPAAHLRLGLALAHLGRYAEAEAALRISLRLSSGQKSAARLLAWVLAQRAMAFSPKP
jgi:tetratricopeptide (TPR) repeat protein